MMFIHDIHALELWLEASFQLMILDGIAAS